MNYHHQGLLVAAAKYLLTLLLSLLFGFYADRTPRLDFLARTSHGITSSGRQSQPMLESASFSSMGASCSSSSSSSAVKSLKAAQAKG
jgi:hypothetical protein